MTRSLVVVVAVVSACHSPPPQKTQAAQSTLLTAQPEQELTQAVGRSLQLGPQTHVQLASDGTGFLAVWIGGPGQLVQATRVAADGTVLDAPPVNVTLAQQAECAVAFDGQDYVVAYRTNSVAGPTPLAAYLQRVSTAGAVTGAPILVASPATQLLEQTVYLACAARVCEVTWTDVGEPGDALFQVKARRFDMAAGVALEDEVLIADSGTGLRAMTPAATGAGFLITMGSDEGGIFVIRAGAAQRQLCSQSWLANDAFGAAGSPDGGAYIVFAPFFDSAAAGTRLDAAGSAIDGCGNFLSGAGSTAVHPHVAWSGNDWFVAWWDAATPMGIGVARVSDATGAVTAAGAPITVPSYARSDADEVHPACSATACAVAWADGRVADGLLDTSARFARIGDDGGSLDGLGTLLAVAEDGQHWPSAAWDGTQFLAAWTEFRDETRNVYLVHVGADGQTLDSPGAPVAPSASRQQHPSVACSSTQCVAVWVEDGQTLVAAHLQSDGGTVQTFSGTDAFTAPSVAELNGSFAVAYGVNSGAWLQLLDSDAGPQLIAVEGPAPVVTSNGQSWLVAWQEGPELRVQRVGADGTFIGSSALLATIGGAAGSSSLAGATNGTDSFVLWTDLANVFGTVVPGDGGATGPVLSLGQAAGSRIAAAASPDGWQGVWTGFVDGGFGVVRGTIPFDGGAVATSVLAMAPPFLLDEPSIAAGPARALVLFNRGDLDAGTFRIHDVLLVEGSGTPCQAATDCGSGYCVDGVCCDTPCGGGDPNDCLSCVTGTCSVLGASHTCRDTAGLCDVAEKCDGDAGTCPADVFAAATVVCRPSGGPCDLAESCTGAAASCPADAFAGAAVVCRQGASLCDAAETCSGTGVQCPADVAMPDGTACSGTDRCFHAFSCQGGVCSGGTAVVCAASDACHVAGTCDSTTGQCSNPAAPSGAACDDGDACTRGDACFGGVCSGTAVTCPAPDECHVAGVCQGPHGTCSVVPKADGASCSKGTCMHGGCVSADMTPPPPSGCGCDAGGPLGVLLALAGLLRRRRRMP
jgi:hypothetical protein